MAATKRRCYGLEGHFWAQNSSTCPEKSRKHGKTYNPDTLLEICAKIVAENITFQTIEERFVRIPEPVQSRIVYWSFPRNERDICMYSSLTTSPGDEEPDTSDKLPFQQGIKLLEHGAVQDALQIGFHLSGTVTEPANPLLSESEQVFRVSISFDRCKITAVKCACGNKDIFWCQHVVALSLYRIRQPGKVQLRLPISETLYQMNREQLQKFIQYLISEHHTDVLPTAQSLADQILESGSEINRLPGAPDPTAGASVEDDNSWHLDEEQVCEQVRCYLAKGNFCSSSDHLASMFAKVREMLKARDSNGARMLTLITEQFLADPRLVAWRVQGSGMSDKCRQLWDKLSCLWVCVVLNPSSTATDRESWQKELRTWADLDVCPLENPDQSHSNHHHHHHNVHNDGQLSPSGRPRTIFHRALEASHLTWEDSHLQFILQSKCSCYSGRQKDSSSDSKQFTSQGLPMWHEHIPTACARVDALRSHGYHKEALRLAVAIVRSMKQKQREHEQYYQWIQRSGVPPIDSDHATMVMYNRDGWIGHLLDPIGSLFNVLTEASLIPPPESSDGAHAGPTSSSQESSGSSQNGSSSSQSYQHVLIPCSQDRNESYLTLALEAALMGLGQQRLMPRGMYAQDKVLKQEEMLIANLSELELETTLVDVMRQQAILLLDGGPCSGLGLDIHTESVPMHTFAKYLYKSLYTYESQLAFQVGLRALRLPVLEALDHEDIEEGGNNQGPGQNPRWFTMNHVETQQYELAALMLSAARDDRLRLKTVLSETMCHIHGAQMLFKLAQETFKMATVGDRPRHITLLKAGFELGLKVMKKTLQSSSTPARQRQEMVHWLVTCGSELGYDALLSLVQTWENFFTPIEATGSVAVTVMSQQTLIQLALDYPRQDELATATRLLALQCATKDPPNCAYTALTLCEKGPNMHAFERCYQIILGATESVLNSDKLFNIARYMEHRNYPHRAYKLAYIAMKKLHIAYNEDRHPAINNIHWACGLSYALGKDELQNMILLVVKNVHCADVLVDVLHRCTLTAPTIIASNGKSQPVKLLSYDKPPLAQLLEAAIRAYINTTHSRLTHISPSRYGDFIEFLSKARETFLLAHDGHIQFAQLIENMKLVYKGKKKLMFLIKERFGM